MKTVVALLGGLLVSLAVLSSGASRAEDQPGVALGDPVEYLRALDAQLYLELTHAVETSAAPAYLVPLGAMQKQRGAWSPKSSERLSGEVTRFTWRVLQGFDSADVGKDLELLLAGDSRAELLFSCDARACGSSVEWANSIFHERILYGRGELQHYRVYRFADDSEEYRMLLYSSTRSADRQYFRAEVLRLEQ